MEMIFNKVTYQNKIKNIDFEFNNKIYALFGNNVEILKKILIKEIKPTRGKIKYKDFIGKKIKTVLIDSNNIKFKTARVKSEINFYCKKNKITDKSFKKNIESHFSLLNLSIDILDKKINNLSDSERLMLYVMLNTLFKFDIIIFNNIFYQFDKNNKKVILSLLNKIKKQKKIVILLDDDVNNLYNYTDETIVLSNRSILLYGRSKDVFTNVETLINNNLSIPYLPLLTYRAKERKNVKLFYQNDVRDVIKDIYKHV